MAERSRLDTTGEIVVGVDGSESSKDALRWAARQAEITGDTLHAFMAWEEPMQYASAVAELDKVLDEEFGDRRGAIRTSLHNGLAGLELVRMSEKANLIVVGGRGHGSIAGALLGSVSQECVHHATCPVVVIRQPVSVTV